MGNDKNWEGEGGMQTAEAGKLSINYGVDWEYIVIVTV